MILSSKWDYRICSRTTTQGETWHGIYEVYYDTDGNPQHCSETEVAPFGDTPEELIEDVKRMAEAAGKPVLRWEDFA